VKKPELRRRPDRPGGIYYARLYVTSCKVDGAKRRREVFTFGTDKLDAQARLDAEIAKISARVNRGGSGAPKTFREIAVAYLDSTGRNGKPRGGRERATIEKLFLPEFGPRRVDRLTAEDWRALHRKRTKKGYTGSGGRDFTTFMAILNFAERDGLIDRVPIRKGAITFPKDKPRTDRFTPEEWRRFIAAFDDEAGFRSLLYNVRKISAGRHGSGSRRADSPVAAKRYARFRETMPVFRALLLSASRLGEITGLTWGAVIDEVKTLRVTQFKTDETKDIPIEPELRALLGERGLGSTLIFRRDDGSAFTKKDVQRAFEHAQRLSGIPESYSTHTIRHTAATWMKERGIAASDRSDFLGHTDKRITARYEHTGAEYLRPAAASIVTMEKSARATTSTQDADLPRP
jgi:integrase